MKSERLRIGVVGLGRLWEARHKPALIRLRDRFEVVALYDQVARRAGLEARQLGAKAVDGLTELIANPAVEAVYLLSPQWFGLHAMALALQHHKPVYCALPWSVVLDEWESLAERFRATGLIFVPELPRRFYPATLRLRELLATRLGAPRLIVGQARLFGFDRYGDPGPSTQLSRTTLAIDPGGNLIDWCRFVYQEEPEILWGTGARIMHDREAAPGHDFERIYLGFPSGGVADFWIGRYHPAWGEASRFLPQPGFQVYAEHGAAWLEMPDRIHWSDSTGVHEERLPMEPSVGEQLNEHFRRLIRGEPSLAATLDDALAVGRLVGKLREMQEGQGRS